MIISNPFGDYSYVNLETGIVGCKFNSLDKLIKNKFNFKNLIS
jgi:hypothetical protein